MKTLKIDKARLKRFLLEENHLRLGAGHGINGGFDACVMQAVDWLAGGRGHSDSPVCASMAIRQYCIRLNDSWLFAKHRDMLKPFAPKIVGTNVPKLEQTRRYIAADFACRVFVPIWMEAAGLKDEATALRNLTRIVDDSTASAARIRVQEARSKAKTYADAYAASAYASYAADAYAASYAADAYAVSAYAADAASAADAADAADAEKKGIADELRKATLECLVVMISAK